jgi:TorA maturation chaperone TorD
MTPATADAELAAVARLLSLAVSTPRAETLEELKALAGALAAQPGAPDDLHELTLHLDRASPSDLAAEYDRLFGRNPVCPPYEGSYDADPFRQTRELADVNGFYLAFGAQAAGPAAERSDHIGCELEFLSCLVLMRLAAAEAGSASGESTCRHAEDAFLADHLGRFGRAFFKGVGEDARAPLYACVARIGERFLAGELERRSLEPASLSGRRRLGVEQDRLRCGEG